GLLAGPGHDTSGQERVDGFRAAMAGAGLSAPGRYERRCRWTLASGQQETARLLSEPSAPTAVVASSAELALGCLTAARALGRRVPDDVALAAFDDPYYGALLDPALTAVSYDPADLGAEA